MTLQKVGYRENYSTVYSILSQQIHSHVTNFSTAFLDPEWFTFETAGTIVVGMDSGLSRPARKSTAHPPAIAASKDSKKLLERDNTWASGIERAAAAATGIRHSHPHYSTTVQLICII